MVFYFYVYQEEEKTEFDYMKISSKILKTKSKLNICYQSFIEQIKPFINKEMNEVTLISTKAIPFITFTRNK